jgi:hypothetical protein
MKNRNLGHKFVIHDVYRYDIRRLPIVLPGLHTLGKFTAPMNLPALKAGYLVSVTLSTRFVL